MVVGCGFIGERIASGAVRRGLETSVLTRSPLDSRKAAAVAPAEVVVADAADRRTTHEVVAGADHVVFAAGGLMPAEAERAPVEDAWRSLPPLLAILEAVAATAGAMLTYISSGGTVYGEPRYVPVDEAHPTHPISSYGRTKLVAEAYVLSFAAAHRLKAQILRCANVYGEDQPPHRSQGAVAKFADHAVRGEPVVIFGDGSIVRDYVYVGDVVDAAFALRDSGCSGVVNIGAGRGNSLLEVVGLVELASGRRLTIEWREARPFDVQEIVLDISRLRRLVDYTPTSLEEGVARVVTHDAALISPSSRVVRR